MTNHISFVETFLLWFALLTVTNKLSITSFNLFVQSQLLNYSVSVEGEYIRNEEMKLYLTVSNQIFNLDKIYIHNLGYIF